MSRTRQMSPSRSHTKVIDHGRYVNRLHANKPLQYVQPRNKGKPNPSFPSPPPRPPMNNLVPGPRPKSQVHTLIHSYLIQILRLLTSSSSRGSRSCTSIYAIDATGRLGAGHGHSLAACIRALEKLSQTLFADFDSLLTGSIAHTDHRTPEVECVGDVGADGKEDQEDKVHWIAEDCSDKVSKSSWESV